MRPDQPSDGPPRRHQRGRRAYQLGRLAEWLCLASLLLRGYWIVAHDLRAVRRSGLGEIDIIARRGTVLAFIEVKARADLRSALEAVSPAQQQRLTRAATGWLKAHPQHSALISPRFDVMVVAPGRWPHHVIDAWRAGA